MCTPMDMPSRGGSVSQLSLPPALSPMFVLLSAGILHLCFFHPSASACSSAVFLLGPSFLSSPAFDPIFPFFIYFLNKSSLPVFTRKKTTTYDSVINPKSFSHFEARSHITPTLGIRLQSHFN